MASEFSTHPELKLPVQKSGGGVDLGWITFCYTFLILVMLKSIHNNLLAFDLITALYRLQRVCRSLSLLSDGWFAFTCEWLPLLLVQTTYPKQFWCLIQPVTSLTRWWKMDLPFVFGTKVKSQSWITPTQMKFETRYFWPFVHLILYETHQLIPNSLIMQHM